MSTQPHIILLNGPPQSGKDESAGYLRSRFDYSDTKFAEPIRRSANLIAGAPINDAEFEVWKRSEIAPGVTGRQWMINYSEVFMKPMFGNDYFGKLACRKIIQLFESGFRKFTISDCGFTEEVHTLICGIREYELDRELSGRSIEPFRITLVHLSRPGTSFDGDSRDYVWIKSIIPEAISNTGDIVALQHSIAKIAFNN